MFLTSERCVQAWVRCARAHAHGVSLSPTVLRVVAHSAAAAPAEPGSTAKLVSHLAAHSGHCPAEALGDTIAALQRLT